MEVSRSSRSPPSVDTDLVAPARQPNGQLAPPRASPPKRVCYFQMNSEADGRAALRLGQVDGELCTHLILSHVVVDAQSGQLKLASERHRVHLEDAFEFKRRYPKVRVLVSVRNESAAGEERFGQPQVAGAFQRAAASNEFRQKLSRHAIEFLQRHQLDGLDLDWQFPNFPSNLITNREHERAGLTRIASSIRSAVVENFYARQTAQQHASVSSQHRSASVGKQPSLADELEPHLLSASVAGQESVFRCSYELRPLASLCDWLNVLAFDYFPFKAYAPFTGPNAPLEAPVEPYVPFLGKLSAGWTARRLLEEGVPAEKLVVGIPTYARAYRLAFRSSQPAAFSLALGARPSARTGDQQLGYGEVLDALAHPDSVMEFDERARVPYLLADQGHTWITYENARSVREKVRYILGQQLAGYMTWSLNLDDWAPARPQANGEPSEGAAGAFPLHRAMLEESLKFER